MIAPPTVRLLAPTLPADPPKPGFPVVAVVAPIVVSAILFAVTGSPFLLLMAVLGPVIAVATLVDGRRHRRRSGREAAARFTAELDALADRVAAAREAERDRLRAFTEFAPAWGDDARSPVIAVSRGTVPSGVEVSGVADPREPAELVRLRATAPELEGAPVVWLVDAPLVVEGPEVIAAAVARALALRLAACRSPASTVVIAPPGEDWVDRLPHVVETGPAGNYRFRGPESELVVSWQAGAVPGSAPIAARESDAVTRAAARCRAAQLATAARSAGIRSPGEALPELVALGDLLSDDPPQAPRGLAAPLGCDGDGVVSLDLVADGPHAVVAGTTGSGKSELLVSWILAMAHGRSPDEVSFVLVDFKGGAAFAPLAGLPHVLGSLSDLDERLARRAIDSLRAEVLHRERALAEAGVRAIDELAPGVLPRLVVVVDEFAALVTDRSELHALFADLAARGRSLGVHLVMCTQRPAGVVRDSVLANVAVRIALRVADRADSLGLVGDDAAARLPASPRGRAILLDGAGVRRTVQVAIASRGDVERISAATPSATRRRPWCEPLPAVVPHAALPPVVAGIPFGLLDLPAEQRQPVAVLEPRHGHVLVLGAPGSGATTALAALAAGAGSRARWLPADPVDLWDVLVDPHDIPADSVLLLDDLDLVLARCPPDHAPELADLVARLLRDGPARGLRLAASARRLAGPVHALAPQFGARLLLRLGGRDEHLLAGGDGATFDPRATAGSGVWEGAVVQVALPESPTRHRLEPPQPHVVRLPERGELAIVAARPSDFARRWDPDRVRVRQLGEPEAAGPIVDPGRTVLLGDPDAWQADWATLARARRELAIVVAGCSPAELRAVTRFRETPPPLRAGEVWLVEGGRVRRAVWNDADPPIRQADGQTSAASSGTGSRA